jgi:hypothetical protein
LLSLSTDLLEEPGALGNSSKASSSVSHFSSKPVERLSKYSS